MTRHRPPQPSSSPWQRRVLTDLRAQAKAQPDLLTVGAQRIDADGDVTVQFSVATADLPEPTVDGMNFNATEEFVLLVKPVGDLPPTVLLDHHRFVGTPHVLSGFYLCLYLDVPREWNPQQPIDGANGVLGRLWDWMTKATQNDFNPDTALFHAVGGVPHITPGTPTIVVRFLPDTGSRVTIARLVPRTEQRFDLAETATAAVDPATSQVPVFFADSDMPLGAGHQYLGELLGLIRYPRPHGHEHFVAPATPRLQVGKATLSDHAVIISRDYQCDQRLLAQPIRVETPEPETTPDAALFTALAAAASRNPDGTPQRLILAVPHPATTERHLLGLQLTAEQADDLRDLVRRRTTTLIPYVTGRINMAAPIEWCFVSDERAAVTTRRDTGRPVTALHDKTVVVLGCGGLGSWVAELVVRAGAKRILISDNGLVTGGLLVRQNYVENDNGTAKAHALQARLTAISDTVDIEPHGPLTTAQLVEAARAADLIIDATVSLKVTTQLDTVTTTADRTATIAQIATDARTGTLGHAIVNPPDCRSSMTALDNALRDHVRTDAALERYRYFWEEPAPGDEFVPTRGCSTPTFHGSAADLAALAGGLITLIAKHLAIPATGSHLIALPHSDITPGHRYIAYQPITALAAA